MLPAPNLDDRHFQHLVDDARRLVQQRCPEWTDHNVSDPGITLIETFAMMVDQLIYRLNRVPNRNYVKFLELIGLELRPPGVARGKVTCWLSAPQPQTVVVRAETEVSTDRTDVSEPVVFSTVGPLEIVPCARDGVGVALAGKEPVDRERDLRSEGFACFSPSPVPGDALLIGLSNPVPSCAVLLRLDCRVSGVGVDPLHPPLVWEALTERGWSKCDVDRDETGGFNVPGDVVVHVPEDHTAKLMLGERRGWLRCRLLAAEPDQPTYSQPPYINSISACTVGGTASIVHARVVRDEVIGISDGTAAQRFPLQHAPVVPWEGSSLVSVDGDEVREWQPVEHFADADDSDPVFHIDAVSGEVVFGPDIRLDDGSIRQYGAIPPKSAAMRMSAYRTGGGIAGNVGTGQIRVLKTSVPYISRLENRTPTVGGARVESMDDLKKRGPLVLRSRGRAVTAEDFEQLTREVAPEIARVHCLPAAGGQDAGVVRVLVVPHVASDDLDRINRADLDPPRDTVDRIRRYLDERRVVGTRLVVEPPAYQGLTVVLGVNALPGFDVKRVEKEVLGALYRLLHPLKGGQGGTGWPIGRAVQEHEVGAALAWIPGVNMAEEITVRLFPADPETGSRGKPTQRLPIAPGALVFSHAHQVRVLR